MCGESGGHDRASHRTFDTASLALAGAACLFGSTFLVMQGAVEDVEPVPFLAVRFGFGLLVLLPLAARRGRPAPGLVRAGVTAGLALTAGYVLQTVGLQYTTTSVSAFVTYLLVVFVPLLAAVVLRTPPPLVSLVGVGLAVAGLVLLTTGGGVGLGRGELLTLGCAVAFAIHILVLADVAPRFDVVQLNVVQFAVVAGSLAVPGLVAGGYDFGPGPLLAALYTGVVVTALAFGLQVWGQRRVSPTRTALLLLIEPVAAAVLGYLTGERLGLAGAAGALLILGGIVVSETTATPVVKRPEEP
jgi:drug/metabolite transporter (DMT)-like permease